MILSRLMRGNNLPERLNRWLLVANLFFLQMYLIRFPVLSVPTNMQEALLVGQVVFFLVWKINGGAFTDIFRNVFRYPVLMMFAVLVLVTLVTLPLENTVDFFRHARFLAYALVMSYVALETFPAREERMNMLWVLACGALAFGIFSVFYNLAGLNVTYDYRLQGPLDSAVYLSYYLTPFFLFSVFALAEGPARKRAWWHYAVPFVFLILILLTRSMGSLAGAFAVGALYFVKRADLAFFRRKWVRYAAIIVGVLLFAVIFWVKILPAFETHNTSLGERDEIWVTSVDLLKNPTTLFFGLGLGQFEANYILNVDRVLQHEPLDYHILQPHNIFLLFWFQFGLLGLIVLLYWIGLVLKKTFSHFARGGAGSLACFLILYFFLHGLIDTPFFKNDLLFLFVFFLQMGLAGSDDGG